jgi:hypothetical protein
MVISPSPMMFAKFAKFAKFDYLRRFMRPQPGR